MHQQSDIPNLLKSLAADNLSNNRLYHLLTPVIKAFHNYTANPEQLPPSENFIPFCLFRLPERLHQLLGMQDGELLLEKPEKTGVRILLGLYLKGLGKLVQVCQAQIRHIVIQGMSKSILLANAYPQILKKWIKLLLQQWSTNPDNLQTCLRSHITLSKYFQSCQSPQLQTWILRRTYVSYFQNIKQLTMRNYQHINFMINSFCQLIKINKQKSYYVLFGYLRSIALEIDKYYKVKRKEKMDLLVKLYGNQILGCFRVFVAVVSRLEGDQFTALIYPLCQILAAYERLTECADYMPLKLHILQFQLTIYESTQIYNPNTLNLLQKLLNSPVFSQKLSKRSQKSQINLQLAYKLSKKQLTQALIVNQLFNRVITRVYKFASVVQKTVYGVQVLMKLTKIVKSVNGIGFTQYRVALAKLAKTLKTDSDLLYDRRADHKMSLTQQKKHQKYETQLSKITLSIQQQATKLQKDEEQLLRNKLAAEQQQQAQGQQKQEGEDMNEDEDQINSGWEQASEGASQMDAREVEEEEDDESEDKEEVSYEGDPEDVDEAVRKWSEEEWSSQQEINN